MNNYLELREFLDSATKEEKEQFVGQCNNIFLKNLTLTLMGEDKKLFQETVLENLDSYLPFVHKFYHQEITNVLFFGNLELAKKMIKANEPKDKIVFVMNQMEIKGSQLLSFVEELVQKSPLELSYDVKNQSYALESAVAPYSYLMPMLSIKHDDEFDLLCSVMDSVPMEIISQGDHVVAVVKNESRQKVEENKDNIKTKVLMICSRVFNSPVTKYAGVALALGLVMMGSAEASSKDAVDYIEAVNNSLSQMGGDLPAGCEFGAKVIAKNGLGITYEVNFGDYSVSTQFLKAGNAYESVDQTVSKLKEMKGCGMSKADAVEMANKVHMTVKKLWLK